MTIPDPDPAASVPPAAAPSGGNDRVRRPEPARDGPWRAPFAPSTSAPPRADVAPPATDTVSETVAHAVRLGYDVIGENIRQGREAAGRFRHGDYNVRDVPHDLNRLSIRLLNLTRELTTTTFDLLDRVLNDPNTPGASPRPGQGNPAPPPFYPPSFTPRPQPTAPTSPPSHAGAARASDGPAGPILSCEFTGTRQATLKPCVLTRPERPTRPESLTVTPLAAIDPTLKAIVGVTFAASADGAGVVARIAIPDDQPAGSYSGVVYAPGAEAPLGVLAIAVL
jgi:hypothetical protein